MRASRLFHEEGKGNKIARNPTDRDMLIEWQEKRLREHNQMYFPTLPTYYALPCLGIGSHCRVPLYSEKEANINCLSVFRNLRLREKYFIGRTITHSLNKFSLVSVIVENWDGKHALQLYIMTVGSTLLFVPAGIVVIITRPKVREMYNGNYILWCTDHLDVHFIDELGCKRIFPDSDWKGVIPTQFLHLRQESPTTTTKRSSLMYDVVRIEDRENELVEQFIHRGNELFILKKYEHALQFYHRAHKIAGNDTDILLNRSIAYLKLGFFSLAYGEANHALKFKPLLLQAIVRKVRALSSMNRYEESIEFLRSYTNDPDFKQNEISMAALSIEEIRIQKMLAEHQSGIYNMRSLLVATNDRIEECGEYMGPLEFKEISGKGRGVVAKRSILAGDVIMATRAYELIHIEPGSDKPCGETNLTESQKTEISLENVKQLAKAITKHLFAEPHSKQDVLSLYAGPQMNYLNREDVTPETEINVHRIKKIIDYNAFSFRCHSNGGNTDTCNRNKGIGLWILPSYFNHSCMDCNSFWKVYGDFLFVRAFKDILIGEEILIPYFAPTKNYLSRKIDLANVGINCDCSLCRIEKTISKADLQKKLEIMERCNRLKRFGEPNLQTHQLIIRRDLEALKKIYKNRKFNMDLINLWRESSCYYITQGNISKAIEELKLAHSLCTGTCLCEHAVTYAINIMWLLLQNEWNRGNAKKWTDILKRDLIIAYGSVDIMAYVNEFAVTLAAMQRCGIQFR